MAISGMVCSMQPRLQRQPTRPSMYLNFVCLQEKSIQQNFGSWKVFQTASKTWCTRGWRHQRGSVHYLIFTRVITVAWTMTESLPLRMSWNNSVICSPRHNGLQNCSCREKWEWRVHFESYNEADTTLSGLQKVDIYEWGSTYSSYPVFINGRSCFSRKISTGRWCVVLRMKSRHCHISVNER